MKFEKYSKYEKNIEKLMKKLMPKVNVPLAVAGFLIAVSGIVPVLVMVINSTAVGQPLAFSSVVASFFLYMISFFGYMLIHRSMERDWL